MDNKFLIIAVAAIVAIAAVGAVIVLNGNDNSSDNNGGDDITNEIVVKTLDLPADTLLRVFGNVNGDAYINNDDMTYLKAIIKGEKEQTFYADVNQDGVINNKDVTYLQGIIKGDPTRLYYQNYKYDVKSVAVPIDKMTVIYYQVMEAVVLLGAFAKAVATDEYTCVDKASQFPGIEKMKNLGQKSEITAEDLMSTGATTIISGSATYHISEEVEKQLPANYDMVRLCNGASGPVIVWHVVTLGYILGSDGGYNYLDFYNKCMNTVKERTTGLNSEVPKSLSIYFDSETKFKIHCENSGSYEVSELARTENVADGFYEKYSTLYYYPENTEFVYGLEKDPGLDLLIFTKKSTIIGSDKKTFMDDFYNYMKSVGLDKLKNYQDGKAIAICYNLTNGTPLCLGPIVIASLLYPDSFKDVNVYEYLQEFYDKFTMMKIDVTKNAFFFCTSQDLIDAGYKL